MSRGATTTVPHVRRVPILELNSDWWAVAADGVRPAGPFVYVLQAVEGRLMCSCPAGRQQQPCLHIPAVEAWVREDA